MQSGWRIELFGGVTACHGERRVTRFPTQRARALLAYLATHPDRAHPREFLAEMLWPEGDPDAIRLRLNQTVAEIRRALTPADQLLLSDRFTLQLHPAVSCDVADFRAALERAQCAADPERRARALRGAADTAQREFLPGCYDDWALEARQELADAWRTVLLQLSAMAMQRGDWPAAVADARRAAVSDPLCEEAAAVLLRALLGAGRVAEAWRHYSELEHLLSEQLGVAPGAEIRQLMSNSKRAIGSEEMARSNPGDTAGAEQPALHAPLAASPAHAPAADGAPLPHALQIYVETGDAERGMRLAGAMMHYWSLRGELRSGYAWLQRLLNLPNARQAPADARAI